MPLTLENVNLEGVVSLVAHGLGVSVVPRRNIDRPFPAAVKVVPFGTPAVTRTLGILQRVDNPRAHFVQQLFDELAALSQPSEATAPSAAAGGA